MSGIYLDYQSACPVDPHVVDFAGRYLTEESGNPSALHSAGISARTAVEEARAKVADLINAEDPSTIIFTGSATEANNLAIHGTAARNANQGKKVLASAVEHISVLNPMKYLQKVGFNLSMIPVDSTGTIDLSALGRCCLQILF